MVSHSGGRIWAVQIVLDEFLLSDGVQGGAVEMAQMLRALSALMEDRVWFLKPTWSPASIC